MSAKSTQNRVFSRTGRKRILKGDVQFSDDGGSLLIERVKGGWVEGIDQGWLEQAEVHLDVRSLLYAQRETVQIQDGVLSDDWKGAAIKMPKGFLSGDYRVKLQVSVVLPPSHDNAGRILAKSEEVIIHAGPVGPDTDTGEGGSLLHAVPDASLDNICSLEIGHKGPKLLVRSELERVPWKTFAASAAFKFGVFPLCLEQVLIHIALSDEQPWMQKWRALDGVKGTEHEIQEDDGLAAAYDKARTWARDCVRNVAIERGALELFVGAWNKERV